VERGFQGSVHRLSCRQRVAIESSGITIGDEEVAKRALRIGTVQIPGCSVGMATVSVDQVHPRIEGRVKTLI
jgi:hypothetical protein